MQNVQTTKTNYSVSEPLSKLNIKKKIEKNFPYDQAGIEFTLLKEFFFFEKNHTKICRQCFQRYRNPKKVVQGQNLFFK